MTQLFSADCLQRKLSVSKQQWNYHYYKECFPDLVPAPSQVKLCSYTGESITVVGSFNVNVVYKSQSIQLPLVIVKGLGPTLMGRNWFEVLRLD